MRATSDRVYGSARPEETLRALDASFGSWVGRADDGARYVEGLRHGMAHRLAD